ncbi:CBS-domain-containing membrane protein [Streptacidiphilus sp. BW17]
MNGSGSPHFVGDVMTQTVVSVGREAGFKDIVALMAQCQVSALPVTAVEGRVVGVVSEVDLLPKEEFRDEEPSRPEQVRRLGDMAKASAITAAELMTSPAVTVRADAALAQAAREMARHHVKRLPVVDEWGVLAGVVSRADLLKVFLRPDEEIAEEVRREVVAYLFGDGAIDVVVEVTDGVVTLTGRLPDTMLVPVAARLTRAVEGVVDVRWDVTGQALVPRCARTRTNRSRP